MNSSGILPTAKRLASLHYTPYVESLLFLDGAKPGIHGAVRESDIETLNEICDDIGKHCVVFEPSPDDGHSGTRNKYFLGHTEAAVQDAKNAYDERDWSTVGEFLGYPECCVETFKCERNPDAYILEKVDSTTPHPFYTNTFPRKNGARFLLSYFPCSYDCEHSVELGKQYFHVIKKYHPERAADVKDFLQSAVIYKHNEACVTARNYSLDSDTVTHTGFKDIRNTPDDFLETVNQTTEFTINSPHSVTIGDTTIEGDDIAVVLFE